MRERTLFDDELPGTTSAPAPLLAGPSSHAGDPATSAEAAQNHDASRRAAAHARLVLELVRKHPSSTAVELWSHCNEWDRFRLVEMQEVRRRLTDLHRAGRVHQGEARPCRVKGSRMVTWTVTESLS